MRTTQFADDDLDALILATVDSRWLKVARIIVATSESLGDAFDAGHHEQIADRIAALAAAGRIESRGDLSRWGFREVRSPAPG